VKGELEKAYLAGFFDGEGCIWLSTSGGKYFQIHLAVAQKYPAVLDRFVALWGGRVYPDRCAFRWRPRVKDMERVLRDLLPYLAEKKTQAILAILYLRRKRRKELSYDQQFHCARTMKALKRIPACQHNMAEIRRIFRKESVKLPLHQDF
jgi:hypothetical protein